MRLFAIVLVHGTIHTLQAERWYNLADQFQALGQNFLLFLAPLAEYKIALCALLKSLPMPNRNRA